MEDQAKEIQERLNPTHLTEEKEAPPSDEDLKKQVEEASVPFKGKVKFDLANPKAQKKYTFQLDHKDAQGHVWDGSFTNKILTVHERTQAGTMRAMITGGQPMSSLDAMTVELSLMISHLSYSLMDKPEWAENLRSIEDPGVIQAIYEEVNSHENYFLGW